MKKQKIQGFFFGCLDKMMVEELSETKKTQVFFVFLHGLFLHIF